MEVRAYITSIKAFKNINFYYFSIEEDGAVITVQTFNSLFRIAIKEVYLIMALHRPKRIHFLVQRES